MEHIRKGSKVTKICDGITSRIALKDYIMLDDNWIDDHNTTLYDQHGIEHSVLDFQEVDEYVMSTDECSPYGLNWEWRKFSCVKLDKDINIGDLLYTSM